ncbi:MULTISPECIES: sigma factor-like helix-turn-helix DNA-binding protein [unclassified Mycobacterium]|uniref:sigma factor-like helix-turn-helix DNA-binding protein n=1 Tax=unclassified Mycobacterium TaxID=2642494 RepID=UPI000800F368|nr:MULTISPECIES: sigma factor-like helix-turn-helix DNA-binding protein [unclassified Mycobacterium]OBG70941.1 hypothetical protein A5700_13745 [Mycobacterium sp. E1214]OBH30850.1 hypothetical protein A5693_17360 [Mycobacterium sp. E1319]
MKAQGIDALGALFDRAAVSEALDRLEQSHREVFVRAYCLRWTTRRIAADLNITEPVVKCRLHHALHALRRDLDYLLPHRR